MGLVQMGSEEFLRAIIFLRFSSLDVRLSSLFFVFFALLGFS